MALTDKLTALGDAIREKNGTTGPMTLDEMAVAVENIQTSVEMPEDLLILTENQMYKFYNSNWDSFIEIYKNQITSENLTDTTSMFQGSQLSYIPITLNYKTGYKNNLNNMFMNASIVELPVINIDTINSLHQMCSGCSNLRYINLDFTNIDISGVANGTYYQEGFFPNCSSLRELPQDYMDKLQGRTSAKSPYYTFYASLTNLYNLDTILSLPVFTVDTYTSNAFSGKNLYRLQDFIFKTQEDGTPYTANWKSQTIDLSTCGFCKFQYNWYDRDKVLYNSGITIDKCIYNDETYQALKDDPDNYVAGYSSENPHYYSRYDKASAIRTINSLPDVSASGGTNTIKFKGEAGLKTDNGAINTMTEEEIAVATAKGWTVSFV